MKTRVIAALLFLLLAPLVAWAGDDEVVSAGQNLIRLKYNFLEEKVPWKGSMYAHGTYFMNTDNYNILFTYLGPRFRLKNDADFYVLGGTRNDPDGMSATASMWLNVPFNKVEGKYKDDLFAEADWYIPVLGGHVNKFYTNVEYNHNFQRNVSMGMMSETVALMDNWEFTSFSFGPTLYVGYLGFYPNYDFQAKSVNIRLFFTLPNLLN